MFGEEHLETVLPGAKFKLYKDEKEIGTYITDENGNFTATGLYLYEDEKGFDQTYTLREVMAPEGYVKTDDIVFDAKEINGELELEEKTEDDSKLRNYIVSGNTINLIVEDSQSFKLIKKDEETSEPLANVKFAIYNLDNGIKEARNSKGEIVGTKEIINGKEYYIVLTDVSGEINLDLPEGLYKAVEVEADAKYDLTNNTYYFGVGTNKELGTTRVAEWGKVLGGNGDGGSDIEEIMCVKNTSDGGFVAAGKT